MDGANMNAQVCFSMHTFKLMYFVLGQESGKYSSYFFG